MKKMLGLLIVMFVVLLVTVLIVMVMVLGLGSIVFSDDRGSKQSFSAETSIVRLDGDPSGKGQCGSNNLFL